MHYEAVYLGPYGSISTGWRRLEYGEPRLIVASEKDRLIRENPDWVSIVTEGDRIPVHRGARLPTPTARLTAPLPATPAAGVRPEPAPEPVVAEVSAAPEESGDFADLGSPTITVEAVRRVAPKVSEADAAELAIMLNDLPDASEKDLRAYEGVTAAIARKLLALRESVS